jgi:nucleoside 2-deoxyribosyltransferase
MTNRIYLAGPEVFLVNARDIGARKLAICERHGLVGVFPAEAEEHYCVQLQEIALAA